MTRALLIRLYRLLLLAQPREVRRRYAAEMLELLHLRAAEHASPRFWMHELRDLAAAALRGHRARLGQLLILAAAVHTAYALSVYPNEMMGGFAIALTAGALVAGSIVSSRPVRR